jgi:DNA-directed RNA polymerase specialized sigma24 family protein
MSDEAPAEFGREHDKAETGRRQDWVETGQEHDWFDEDAGPVVRPYTVTGGRARPTTGGLDLLSYVEALYAPDADLVNLQPEHRAILALTHEALSVAEIAARLDLPIGVVKVLVGDLLQANLVSTFDSDATIHPPDANVLQAVIDGLRAL